MKLIKMLIAVASLAILVSCSKAVSQDGKSINELRTVEIEGCEYFVKENAYQSSNAYSFSMCHKGNCKNKIHTYNTIEKKIEVSEREYEAFTEWKNKK